MSARRVQSHALSLTRVRAECVTAVNVAAQDQLTLSISVAVGSTIVRTSSDFSAYVEAYADNGMPANGSLCYSIHGHPGLDPRQAARSAVRSFRVRGMYPKSGSMAYVTNNTLFPLGTLHFGAHDGLRRRRWQVELAGRRYPCLCVLHTLITIALFG